MCSAYLKISSNGSEHNHNGMNGAFMTMFLFLRSLALLSAFLQCEGWSEACNVGREAEEGLREMSDSRHHVNSPVIAWLKDPAT